MTEIIVVGVDGSEGSDAALQWAMREAALRSCELRVVHAWLPLPAGYPYASWAPAQEFERGAERLLRASLERAGIADRDVDARAVAGSAADVLLEAAKDADMIVVGSRGRGGFAGLLLGSVSHQVATHAPCPVVIVRGA